MKIFNLSELKASQISKDFERVCKYKGLTFLIWKDFNGYYCFKCQEKPNEIFLNGSHYKSLSDIKNDLREELNK